MKRLDLNCDLGEGCRHDEELMPLITSANIACGGHAGDATSMKLAVSLAKRHGVVVGAHPGFADRENFGRYERAITPDEAAMLVGTQVQDLRVIAGALGEEIHHVKLHGALYNQVSRDGALAAAVARVIHAMEPRPILYALAGSEFERVAGRMGVRVVPEVFADRTYQRDGSLTPRNRPDALIADAKVAVAQGLRMAREGRVRTREGEDIAITAGTLCVHGDGSHAVEFAHGLRAALRAAGVEIGAPGRWGR